MHTDKLFVVFGSDSRYVYTVQTLRELGYEAVSFGDIPPERFAELRYRDKAAVLSVPFSRDGKSVNLASLPYTVTLRGLLSILRQGDILAGGKLNRQFTEECEKRSVICYDYYNQNMILENARLTARSLIKLMEKAGIDCYNLRFAVTGFGRTAKAIAEEFSERNISFFIAARSKEAQLQAAALGYEFAYLDSFDGSGIRCDVIINTVPALIFDSQRLSGLGSGLIFIDIASAPYGITEEDAAKSSVRLIRALSLPGRYMPREAGKLIAESIDHFLKGR